MRCTRCGEHDPLQLSVRSPTQHHCCSGTPLPAGRVRQCQKCHHANSKLLCSTPKAQHTTERTPSSSSIYCDAATHQMPRRAGIYGDAPSPILPALGLTEICGVAASVPQHNPTAVHHFNRTGLQHCFTSAHPSVGISGGTCNCGNGVHPALCALTSRRRPTDHAAGGGWGAPGTAGQLVSATHRGACCCSLEWRTPSPALQANPNSRATIRRRPGLGPVSAGGSPPQC